jgi:hypothetical protein
MGEAVFDSIILNMLTSSARAALVGFAGYLETMGVLQSSQEPQFVAGGLVLVSIAWAWYEKISHKQQIVAARGN